MRYLLLFFIVSACGCIDGKLNGYENCYAILDCEASNYSEFCLSDSLYRYSLSVDMAPLSYEISDLGDFIVAGDTSRLIIWKEGRLVSRNDSLKLFMLHEIISSLKDKDCSTCDEFFVRNNHVINEFCADY